MRRQPLPFFTESQDHKKRRRSAAQVGAVLCCAAACTSRAAPPGNDDFQSAYAITGLPVTAEGGNQEATRQPGEPDSPEGYGRASLWWRWTAPSAGWVEVSTAGSDYDTTLNVYSGNALASLTLLTHNDDALRTKQSRVRFQAVQGTEYRIQVQSWFQAQGTAKVKIEAAPAPQAPVLKSLKLTPDAVVWAGNVSDGPVVSAEAEVNSPDGLAVAEVTVAAPFGPAKTSGNLLDFEEPSASGSKLGTGLWIPHYNGMNGQSSFRGDWSATVSLKSDFGETVTYGGPGGLPFPVGSTTLVKISGADDVGAPVITGGTISQQTVDVTDSAKTISAEISVSEDNGVDLTAIFLYNSKGQLLQEIGGFGSATLISGTVTEGTWKLDLSIPAFLAPGTYTVSCRAYDIVARSQIPFEKTITVINNGVVDSAAPEITAVSVGRTRISMTELPVEIPIRMEISDATEIQDLWCDFRASWSQGLGSLQRTSRTGNAEVWEGTLTIPAKALPGSYPMQYRATDSTGNQTLFSSGGWLSSREAPLPVPAGWPTTFTITPGPEDAYSVWRAKYPQLAGAQGEFDADADADGWTNAVEFLCGTDPLLPSGPGKADPNGERVPAFSSTSSALRWEFRLSSANLVGGEGTYWRLQKSRLLPAGYYSEDASWAMKDLFRVELPITDTRGFMQLMLGTRWDKMTPYGQK